jgi:hypothetical protein
MRKVSTVVLCVLIAAASTACATTATTSPSDYATVTDQFNKGLSSATDVIQQQVNSQTHVRRVLAAQYFLDHPTDSEQNFARTENPHAAFAKYACAGVDAKVGDQNSVSYLKRYGAALEDIGKQPDATIGALWSDIRSLRAKESEIPLAIPPGTLDPNTKGPKEVCIDSVTSLLERDPIPLNPTVKESLGAIIALFEAINTLVDAIKAGVVDVLKPIDEAARQKAFRTVVLANQDNVHKALDATNSLSKDLKDLWLQQQQSLLVIPYEHFATVMAGRCPSAKKSASSDTNDQPCFSTVNRGVLLEHLMRVDTELADFDQRRTAQPPQNILAAVGKAQDQLEMLANQKVQIKDVLSFLKAFMSEMDQLQKDYATIAGDVSAVKKAVPKG